MLNKFISSAVRSTKYYLIQYNEKNYRLLKIKSQLEKGWELIEGKETKEKNTPDYEIERISLSRTKRKIRELALCNNFEYFGTITINGYFLNRYELSECQSRLKKVLRRIRDRNKELKYLIITERHKDNAFHFHGLFSGLDLIHNEYGYLYNPDFSKDLGFNSFSPIVDYSKCCNYITKYISKDCVRNSTNQIFFRSKNLRFATKEEIPPIELGNNWKFDNDFCSIYDFNLDDISELEKNLVMDLIRT